MDRSPERVVISVRRRWVRYFHRVKKFQKTRSERSKKRKWTNDTRYVIKVDVSKPSYPYEEPIHCVKLAVHHQVAAFYTNHILHCGTASFCNELCDFVCGGKNNFNNCNSVGNNSKDEGQSLNPFEEDYIEQDQVHDDAFVNIDVQHKSVWFCRSCPTNRLDIIVVKSSTVPVVHSESATETECSGPSSELCFRWHKDLERSFDAVRMRDRSNSDLLWTEVHRKNIKQPMTSTPKKQVLNNRLKSPCRIDSKTTNELARNVSKLQLNIEKLSKQDKSTKPFETNDTQPFDSTLSTKPPKPHKSLKLPTKCDISSYKSVISTKNERGLPPKSERLCPTAYKAQKKRRTKRSLSPVFCIAADAVA